jgi:hypothetical protein
MMGLLGSLLLADICSFASNDRSAGDESVAGAPQDAAEHPIVSPASFDEARAYSNDLSRPSVRHLRLATFASRQSELSPKVVRAVRLAHLHEGNQPAHSLVAQCVCLLI